MNAAFLILTSALLGNHPSAAPCNGCSAPAPAPACATCNTPAPACSNCGHGSSWGGGQIVGRLRGMFSHHSKCDSCAAPAPASCNGCGAAPAAAPCDGCGAAPAPAAPATGAPAGDAAPKQMPEAPKTNAPPVSDAPKGDKATRLQETPDAAPLAIPGVNPVLNSRPSVIVAPATLRNPF